MKSHQISAFFLLVTVLLSSTLARNSNGPEECCFRFFPGKLKKDIIAGYVETREDCSKTGIIFYTTSGSEVCVDPKEEWVQAIKKELDHPPHQKKWD